jgi:hypothetical protein
LDRRQAGGNTFPSRTGRPQCGQNSEISGMEAPQYPQEIGMQLKGYQENYGC